MLLTASLPFVAMNTVALQILVNLWSLTGTAEINSKLEHGSKVPDGDLFEGIAYHAFVTQKALEHPWGQGPGLEASPSVAAVGGG